LVTVIEPQGAWVALNLGEIWRYRDLLFQMVYRDFSAKYRQTVLGFAWAVINPIVQMVLFTLVFGKMAKLPSDGIPYPVFSYTGLLPWLYFSGCLTRSSESALSGTALLTKVYFPRLILPLSKVTNGLIDFGVQFAVLLVLMIWYGVAPSWGIVCLPLFVLLCALSALAVGLWASALSVKYRDVTQVIGFVARMWMWVTPVLYSVSLVPERWRPLYSLNPMVGVLEGFRWAMLGKSAPDWRMMAISTGVTVILFVGGLYFFRRTEATFADVI
jgi:lipopolysaccharide transport system permease protein